MVESAAHLVDHVLPEQPTQVQFGMTRAEAIRSATVRAADLLGISDQVGRIPLRGN